MQVVVASCPPLPICQHPNEQKQRGHHGFMVPAGVSGTCECHCKMEVYIIGSACTRLNKDGAALCLASFLNSSSSGQQFFMRWLGLDRTVAMHELILGISVMGTLHLLRATEATSSRARHAPVVGLVIGVYGPASKLAFSRQSRT
jgi:hypothetical protein